jgi:signal transduction histidine kinase
MDKKLIDILLVEDDPAYRHLVDIILAKSSLRSDYNMETANTLSRAVERVKEKKFDVILLDLGLPDSNNTDSIEKIRGLSPETAIIVLTGQESEETGLDAIRKGADDYFIKDEAVKGILARTLRYVMERKKIAEELRATQEKLVETARKAGMADVATDILHNVGNILNSINVSVHSIEERVLKSQAENLKTVADMIRKHVDDLATFLTEDQQGKHIPVYLTETSRLIVDDYADITKNLRTLIRNVEHIEQVIKAQQGYAKIGGIEVLANINEVIEDAIRINNAGLKRHEVNFKLELAELPSFFMDKQIMLQILVNLISNGKYALAEIKEREKILTIRSYMHGEDRLRIEVADNGIGIPKENMVRIFMHGFTTKQDGHGFGLHSSALAAKALGGSLAAHSNGLDQGAKFTLELPLKLSKVLNYNQDPYRIKSFKCLK